MQKNGEFVFLGKGCQRGVDGWCLASVDGGTGRSIGDCCYERSLDAK